ncbi:MAG: 16S rRNA (cytidine(1402)-2'-O)-methyltransferase [Anaerolineales bacterium]|nr:16S rRNA (cytidine(1402)-2'-O)-methyltransferase [Anaerolineales bacterium]
MGKLYLVATPIGNLEDISARALRILREAAVIAAEDTRTTGKLLAHYGIRTPMIAYHEHNKLTRIEAVLERLAAGDVALVSDAGTPGLNDPGYELVRAALAAGYEVSPIPGPCAPVAALTASGLPTDSFIYLGYLPRRSAQRKTLLEEMARERRTLIALETPHRLVESLEDILATLGDRPLAVGRELTKLHEEFVRGSVNSAVKHFHNHPPLGEITLVIGGAADDEKWSEEQVFSALKREAKRGRPASELAEEIAAESGWNKRDVYKLIHT